MPSKPLSAEQVDLLHHVELSEAGWHDRVIDQFVLSACLNSKSPLGDEQIRKSVADIVDSAGLEQTRRSIQRLVQARKLVEIQRGEWSLSEGTRRDVEVGRSRTEETEGGARKRWEECVAGSAAASQVQLNWDWFRSRVLDPLIKTQGVRTYELLTSKTRQDEVSRRLLSFLDEVPEQLRPAVRQAVEAYLAGADSSVREFILRLLHAHLLSMAAGLPVGSLEAFQGNKGKRVELKLLLDTNFLFSLLGLHENPSNEAAADLVGLLQAVSQHVSATLYVTPLTIDEVRRTLSAYESRLGEMAMSPKLGEIASNLDGGLSGIAMKYFDAAKKAKKRLTVSDYLGPYLRDLLTLLRSRGIELYNENLEALSTSQPVIDDILGQQAYEENKPNKKAKSYEALRHDVTLWHLVAGRRPARLDAPLDAVYWIATVDYRLLGFDLHKRHNRPNTVPICVHPAALVQMLQLWLPRNPKLDAALIDSLVASMPHFFDSDAEEMSIRILRALSRYEDVDDLPEATVTSILMNQALRARMRTENEVDKQAALVRDEIIQAAAATRAELEKERLRVLQLQADLEKAQATAAAKVVSAGQALDDASKEIGTLKADLERERGGAETLQQRLQAIEAALASDQAERERQGVETRNQKWRLGFSGGALALAVAAVAIGWWTHGRLNVGMDPIKLRVAIAVVATSVWLTLAVGVGDRMAAIASWNRFVQFRAVAVWLRGIAWIALSTVILSALYDWIKS